MSPDRQTYQEFAAPHDLRRHVDCFWASTVAVVESPTVHRVFTELSKRSSQPHWMSLAVDAGYYDQAHMINECRELTGLSPSELRSAAGRFGASHDDEFPFVSIRWPHKRPPGTSTS